MTRSLLQGALFTWVFAFAAVAENRFPQRPPAPGFDVRQVIQQLNYNTNVLQNNLNKIPRPERQWTRRQVDNLVWQLQQISDELAQPQFQAGWYQANQQECVTYCRGMGLNSGLSPEGAQCTSGENQVNSALGAIVYTYGTWGSPGTSVPARSSGAYCYKGGQKQDNDKTDITVGCYCEG